MEPTLIKKGLLRPVLYALAAGTAIAFTAVSADLGEAVTAVATAVAAGLLLAWALPFSLRARQAERGHGAGLAVSAVVVNAEVQEFLRASGLRTTPFEARSAAAGHPVLAGCALTVAVAALSVPLAQAVSSEIERSNEAESVHRDMPAIDKPDSVPVQMEVR